MTKLVIAQIFLSVIAVIFMGFILVQSLFSGLNQLIAPRQFWVLRIGVNEELSFSAIILGLAILGCGLAQLLKPRKHK